MPPDGDLHLKVIEWEALGRPESEVAALSFSHTVEGGPTVLSAGGCDPASCELDWMYACTFCVMYVCAML